MIVKERDATQNRIAYLDTYDAPDMDSVQRQGLKRAAARLRADSTSENACCHIDNYFAESEDWLVIHDLRMRYARHTMQINHLLINRSFEFYIIDSRYIKTALVSNENGQCWAQSSHHNTPIASPWNKLSRDIRILREIIKNKKALPRFLGISPTIKIQGYILTNPALRSHQPPSTISGDSAVIASDALFATIWEKRQGWMRSKLKKVDTNALHEFGQTLLSLHIPAVPTKLMKANISQINHRQEEEQDTAHCAQCSKPVTAHVREVSFRHMGIFKSQVLCTHCQSVALNKLKHRAQL